MNIKRGISMEDNSKAIDDMSNIVSRLKYQMSKSDSVMEKQQLRKKISYLQAKIQQLKKQH